MAFERVAEQKIREAMAQGEFDNLPGAGKPIDLDEYFQTPEHLRMAYSILKSARCLPQEIDLMNEIAALDRALGEVPSVDARRRLQRLIRDRRLQLALALDRARRQRR
jgi:DnaJ-like protein